MQNLYEIIALVVQSEAEIVLCAAHAKCAPSQGKLAQCACSHKGHSKFSRAQQHCSLALNSQVTTAFQQPEQALMKARAQQLRSPAHCRPHQSA